MDIRPLKPELQEKAIRELNEDKGRIQEAFDHIRDWLQKQPHLNVRKDNQTMIAFFRGCKWNIQAVKQKLDYFYSIKSQITEFFGNRDPLSPSIQKVLKAGIIFPLPKVENYFGPVIIMCNFKNVDMSDAPFIETVKVFFMTLDILLREDDDFVVSGISLFNDYDHCPCFQNAYPLRVKSIMVFNTMTAFEPIYKTIIRPCMTAKLGERMQVLNVPNSRKFFNKFPKNLLPEEYGGTNGSMQDAAEKWKNKVESYREWFMEDKKYLTKEELRMGNKDRFENNIGADGTFRNLTID